MTKKTNPSHTKEPWRLDPNQPDNIERVFYDGCLRDSWCRDPVCSETDAARIVACVNACAGMKDPAAEIAALRERADALALQADEWEGKYTIACELLEKQDAEIAAWLRERAKWAMKAWKDEEDQPNMGDVFWRRYYAGFYTATDAAAAGIEAGVYRDITPDASNG